MIRPPSNQHQYDEFWSGDPAFVQPSDDDASRREHASRVARARETGNWGDLLIEGRQPTKFVLQQMRGHQYRWLADQSAAGSMGGAEIHSLAFRCALVDVVNFGDAKVRHVAHDRLGKIAATEIPDSLDSVDPSIVNEIGQLIITKALGLSPKS